MERFIRYLESLTREDGRQDAAALAALRRGLSGPPGSEPAMFPYILPQLTQEEQERHLPTYCLVASLYAFHPQTDREGNLGAHLRRAGFDENDLEKVSPAVERRFISLLRAHPDDLPDYLRQAISLLKSKERPVNWRQLLKDLLLLEHDPSRVQREWARGFWGAARAEAISNEEPESEEQTPYLEEK